MNIIKYLRLSHLIMLSKLARILCRGLHLAARCRKPGDHPPACLHTGDHGFPTLYLTLTAHTAEPHLGSLPLVVWGPLCLFSSSSWSPGSYRTFHGPQERCREAPAQGRHAVTAHCSPAPVLPSPHPGGHGPSTGAPFRPAPHHPSARLRENPQLWLT